MTDEKKVPSFLRSIRFLLTIMAFLGYCMQYMLKINLGIGIVCMVNNTALSLLKQSNDSLTSYKNASFSNNESLFLNNSKYNASNGVETCLFTSQEGGKNGLDGPFVWSKSIQGFMLASYFYGYIITQIPGGWLSLKFGGVKVLGISMLIASILTVITPFFGTLALFSLSGSQICNRSSSWHTLACNGEYFCLLGSCQREIKNSGCLNFRCVGW